MSYYILKDKNPLKIKDIAEWSRWMSSPNRKVKVTQLNGTRVSTVFLGLDQNCGSTGKPILFETMVFGGGHDLEKECYYTWEDAERGHNKMVKIVRGKTICSECDGDGKIIYSCCGDDITNNDTDLCPSCYEHCGYELEDCEECNGTGIE